MIRLFASDLDGTLLGKSHQFDDVIEDTIITVLENGCYFAVATGRSPAMADFGPISQRLYKICLNGAVIVNPEDQLLHFWTIDKETLKDAIIKFGDKGMSFISPTGSFTTISQEQFLENMDKMNPPDDDFDPSTAEFFQSQMLKLVSFDQSVEDILSQDICKIEGDFFAGITQDEIEQFLEDHRDTIVNAPCDDGMFEITANHVNKGEAVRWLCHYLGISEDEAAVYGNGGNDIEMIQMFKHSYAPNTAIPEVLKIAHRILGPYQNYSVAQHIKVVAMNQ